MDFTPGSYKTSSPHASSAGFLKPSLGPTSYPTPPQTHGHTEFSPIPTTSIRGLGIQNCDVEPISAQFPICGPPQPLAQVSQCWTHDTPSSGGFLNPSPNLGAYYGIPFYDDMDVLSTHENSPFAPTTSHANTPDQFAFLSPHQQQSRMGNPVVQGDPVLSGYDMNLRTAPVPRQQQRTVKYSLPNCSTALPTDRGALKRPIAQVDAVPYQASPPSAPSYINHNTGDTLLELNPNVERPAVHGRAQRSPLRSSNVNTQVESITSAPRDDQPVKRQKRRSTTVAKYKCGKCDKDFTRNSNCKSHMKTHDPDRYYPHKCGYGQCTKKFSRKTDLERHVDSVHKKLKNFGCDQCGQYFSRKDTLRRHCEDGCRRRQRQSQRTANTTVPASLGSMEDQRSRHAQHREPGTAYHQTVTTSQTQPRSAFITQTFPGSGSDTYAQFTA